MILFILLIYYLPTASASSDTESDTKFADSVYSLGASDLVPTHSLVIAYPCESESLTPVNW